MKACTTNIRWTIGIRDLAHGELHDSIDHIAVGLLEGGNSLSAGGTRDLLEDKLNVLGIDASLIDSATGGSGSGGSLSEGRHVIGAEASLLSGGHLRLQGLELSSLIATLLNLGLTEEDKGVVVGRRLEHVGSVHDEVDLLALADDGASDARDLLEAELGERLASLGLVAVGLLARADLR